MDKRYTATIGEEVRAIDLDEWAGIAKEAQQTGRKAFLVVNQTKQVIAEG